MRTKKLIFNNETKIIEVVEIDDKANSGDKRNKKTKRNISYIISILSFIMSIGALGISYSQLMLDKDQVDVSIRQFNLDKKPVFQCSVTKEELYGETKYWEYYSKWLSQNDIKNFNEWQAQKYPERNVPYLDMTQSRVFWDAYDEADIETLNQITDDAYADLENEYRRYLYSTNYKCYDEWKTFFYVYEKDHITLKNIGANISNARLNVYTFMTYWIDIGDDISYSFAIDMNGKILGEYWEGDYSGTFNYDSENNAFYIEYTQSAQLDENYYWDLNSLSDFLESDDFLCAIGIDSEDDIYMYLVTGTPVYLEITYLDSEKEEQTDWYQYNMWSNSLDYVQTYQSDTEVPDITKEDLDVFFENNALHVAQTLGYQNAQWRSFYWEDNSYIEEAKQKIVSDLKELISVNGGIGMK